MKKCVVSVAVGGSYPKCQDDLGSSLRKQGFGGDLLFWRDEFPKGSPTHKESPYAFKIAALRHAMDSGHDLAIWADSSVWFIRPLDPLWQEIEKMGYYFITLGWDVGQWCSDEALPKLGIKREEAFGIAMTVATFFGLDLRTELSHEILDWMQERVNDGSFRGSWTNANNVVSDDPRVMGHRHDQTALSVIVHKKGLKVHRAPSYFAYYSATPTDDVVAHCAGRLKNPEVWGP